MLQKRIPKKNTFSHGMRDILSTYIQPMDDSTKVLCPRFDETEILIMGDRPSFFPTRCEILICYRMKKNYFIEAVHQT